MFNTLLIKHGDISDHLLSEICKLKAKRWDYTISQHYEWIAQNIRPKDFHVLVYQNEKLVAYTNLVDIAVKIEANGYGFKGIGNVCTTETGKHYGSILMEETNNILKMHSWRALLLCKDNLVSYYQKYGWVLIEKKINKSLEVDKINYMIYNVEFPISSFEFKGKNF